MTTTERNNRPDAISNIFVDTSRWNAAAARLDELMVRGWEPDYCLALLILGPAGAGKTMTVREWMRRRTTAQAGAESGEIVFTEVPPGCNIKAMAATVLHSLGDPDPDYGSQPEKTRRAVEHIKRRGIAALVIDEMQRLLDQRGKPKSDVASWITGLLNHRACPLILVGEPQTAHVFQGNIYLERRTLGEVTMSPFDWHDDAERLEFRRVMQAMSSQLGLPSDSRLQETDTALRIHSFSDGRLGLASRLIDDARADAGRRGLPAINRDLLADAVDRLRVGDGKRRPNPFRVANPKAGGKPSTGIMDTPGRVNPGNPA